MKIQEFSFGNFKSFKDIQTLNLASAKIKSKNPKIDMLNVIKGKNVENTSFLKSKAIYGANASGKSNIIKALVTFIKIIKTSVKDEEILKMIEPFRLSTETDNQPSFFQMIFWHNNIKYRYGFESNDKQITAEWLYGKPGERELPFFIRDNQEIIELDKTNFTEGHKLMVLLDYDLEHNDIFRNNSLFLSTLATFGFGKLSKQLVNSIGSTIIISGLRNKRMYNYAQDSLKDKQKKKFILDLLQYGDLGIDDIDSIEIKTNDLPDDIDDDVKKDFDKLENKKLLISSKKKFDKNLMPTDTEFFLFVNNESEGTLKLFELSPFIYDAIKEKKVIVIDEFDARFHPLLTKKILELFNSEKNVSSQLIFTTHNTNLLSSNLLRRDQIEYNEKDKYGASHLYSLSQFKGIRNTASYEKDYIQGKYGAIPFLGDFNKLLNDSENA